MAAGTGATISRPTDGQIAAAYAEISTCFNNEYLLTFLVEYHRLQLHSL
jgi:hypothetical protein